MKIGVISSGVDMLVLFRFLAKYDFSYEIVYDDLGWPWADKPLDFALSRARGAIDHLIAAGVSMVIAPPAIELALMKEKKYADVICPLRKNYLLQACLPLSPTGKIGFAGEYVDLQAKDLYEGVCMQYAPSEKQLERVAQLQKKKPESERRLSFRWKEIVMRKYYLQKLGFKSQLVHHSMKADFRYFKDALVDTIVPTSYSLFAYESMLGKFLNTKKQRFHGLDALEKQFALLMTNEKLRVEKYGVHIHYTGTLDLLVREKKWMWMLGKGKEVEIRNDKISL